MRELKRSAVSKVQGISRDERGLSTVEYIIILVLIAVAGIALWRSFGDAVSEKFSGATSEVEGL